MKLSGLIAFWSGSIATIPAGWLLCDGNNGTPDLRDSFVMPAGCCYNPGDNGGALTHDHTFTGDGHPHVLIGGEPGGIAPGSDYFTTLSALSAIGTTDLDTNVPPYRALLPIMVA